MLVIYVILTIGILSVWNTAGRDIRLILPIIPFLFYFLSKKRMVLWVVGGVLLLASVISLVSPVRKYNQMGELKYFASAIDTIVPKDATVVARKPAMVHYYTRRKTIGFPFASRDSVERAISGCEYIIASPEPGIQYLLPILSKCKFIIATNNYALFKR